MDAMFAAGKRIGMHYGEVLTVQFARAEYFYLLIDGQVSFHLTVAEEEQEILVGYCDKEKTPIGWSGISSPKRYATTVKISSAKAYVFQWRIDELMDYLHADQELHIEFLKLIGERSSLLIREAILLLSKYAPNLADGSALNNEEEYQNTALPMEEDIVEFLRRSPFFEIFEEQHLEFIASCVQRRQYLGGDLIYEQGRTSEGMFVLVGGKVSFTYQDSNNDHINFRELSSAGFIVGWSSVLGADSLISAMAIHDTVLYFIPNECISKLFSEYPEFTLAFYDRLMWLIGHQLQAVRARLVSLKFNKEIIAVSNLIDQNATKLSLGSPMHQIPHLLSNRLTIGQGLNLINDMKKGGNSIERSIAANSYDSLGEVRKEHRFYQRLVKVYEEVTHAGDLPTEKVRKIAAKKTIEAFDGVPYRVKGMEHLPTQPGHIFIYNHLRNHPYNTLPNNFQITLDSHFISSVILHKTYGDPGIRIVRIGRGAEYAHQDYYSNQGHIDVYTSESDDESKENREAKRQAFYAEASSLLAKHNNLIISPEGTSYGTDESPGPFKSGAFRLALSMDPEPLVVPISIANFDRRVRKNVFSCVVHEPFRVSSFISDPTDKDQMKAFLTTYQREFELYVKEAVKLAEKPDLRV